MDKLDEYRAKLMKTLNGAPTQSPSLQSEPMSVSSLQIPVSINIPPFDGDQKKWTAFSDLFQNVVKDGRFSGAQKLQYLKSLVTGKAAAILNPFPTSDVNFGPAWSALEERYMDVRATVAAHLDVILDAPIVRDTSNDIESFLDNVKGACSALAAMGRPTTDTDLLVHLMEKKLSMELSRAWRFASEPIIPPSYSDLVTFLNRRAKQLYSEPQPHHSKYQRQPEKPLFKSTNSTEQYLPKSTTNTLNTFVCPACGEIYLY